MREPQNLERGRHNHLAGPRQARRGFSGGGVYKIYKVGPGDINKLSEAVSCDNLLAAYSGCYRAGKGFKLADVILCDVDNKHSDNPEDWIRPKDVATAFADVAFYQYPSRNNMKPKDGKAPRPKFHNLFPIEATTDVNVFTGYMSTMIERFPLLHFDVEVKSPAQLNFGVEGAEITYHGGEKTLTEFLGPMLARAEGDKPPATRKGAIPEGSRNSTLSQAAGALLKRHGDTDEARRRFDGKCAKCEPRLEADEENVIYRKAQRFFHDVIEKSPSYKSPDLFGAPPFAIPTERGYVISPPLLADYYLERHTAIVVTDSGSPRVYVYDGGAYKYRTELEVKAALGGYISEFRRGLWCGAKVAEAYSALLHTAGLHVAQGQLNADPDVVCLKNGLLNLKEWRLYPHDPAKLFTAQLDCDFAEEMPETPAYDKALRDYCEGSPEKRRFVMQYQGAIFSNTPGHKFKRFLLTIGEKDSGKTILKRLTEVIVGEGNYNNCDLADLENNRFAAASLHLKRLSGTNDLRAAKIPEVGRLLQLTGGDSMRVERKGEQDFSMIYAGYIWHVGNNPPIYGGKQNEALYLREILFELKHTIPQAQQDKQLIEKLLEERQGIILKCLRAARKAIYDNGYRFDVPPECERSKAEHKRSNNVISKFLDECAIPLDFGKIDKRSAEKHTAAKVWQAFKCWRDYCCEYRGISRSDFEAELATLHNMEAKNVKQMRRNGEVVGRFYPVMLSAEGLRLNGDDWL